MLDYASLAAVAAVVQEGSFERAARLLNVTSSAISQRIKLLEERVGSVLIVRGQPCTATAAGNLICRHVERVGMLESELRDSLPQLVPASAGDRITLRIGVNADSLGSWFLAAMATFTREEAALLDVVVDDEEHTIDGLKNGQVLAAITSHAQSVQGCKSVELGKLRYRAVASPDFVQRYFPDGVTAESLGVTPSLRFNHKDQMQATWIRTRLGNDVATPAHWLPSTQAFLDASLAGIGWSMNPEPLIQPHLRAGTLIELIADSPLDVPLYWQHTRLQVPTLERLTRAVSTAARAVLL
ncbi:LysR family transcriptional regulator (chromosome initiation inhibitor) [Povalibacter uvarum]|uniref:LysR family transcriptional regulator (Chromosome initiation inhibitor) n=1 Tax=Povalibacter uvarum TaxID=732238 RepID=A0A841HMH1_9GAMM|nr:LysR family transcriptional regulator ArgP [Povalibacter uvarum]MBB6093943.1 LysR family transcriptional regulator (chromosome initiation inhibitor) [Povalibacter uvarum]